MSATDPDRDRQPVGLRPLRPSEIVGVGVRFVLRAPGTALGIGVVGGFASAMANIVALGTQYPLAQERLARLEPLAADPQAADQTALSQALVQVIISAAGLLLTISLLALPVLMMANAMVISSMGRSVLGEVVSMPRAWADVRPKLGRVLAQVLAIVATLALCALPLAIALSMASSDPVAGLGLTMLLAPLCLVVLLLLTPRMLLAPVCLVLEDVQVPASFLRARQLARGQGLRVVGLALIAVVVSQVVGSLVGLPFDVLAGADPLSTQAVFLTSLGRMAGTAVALPLFCAIIVAVYVDLRVRVEGFGRATGGPG